jgi:hypothetical protein
MTVTSPVRAEPKARPVETICHAPPLHGRVRGAPRAFGIDIAPGSTEGDSASGKRFVPLLPKPRR